MNHYITRKRWWFSSISAGFGLLLGGVLVAATPPANSQQIATELHQKLPLAREWLDLRQRFSPIEIEDAKRAATVYREFYERHFSGAFPSQEGDLAIEIVSRTARLLALEADERDQALKLLENAMERWQEPRLRAILQREYRELGAKDTLLTLPSPSETMTPLVPEVSAARIARVAPLLELLAEQQNAYLLWESGKWNVDDLVWALQHGINSHGVVKGRSLEEGKQVREALRWPVCWPGMAASVCKTRIGAPFRYKCDCG